jgi:hypothetical protein
MPVRIMPGGWRTWHSPGAAFMVPAPHITLSMSRILNLETTKLTRIVVKKRKEETPDAVLKPRGLMIAARVLRSHEKFPWLILPCFRIPGIAVKLCRTMVVDCITLAVLDVCEYRCMLMAWLRCSQAVYIITAPLQNDLITSDVLLNAVNNGPWLIAAWSPFVRYRNRTNLRAYVTFKSLWGMPIATANLNPSRSDCGLLIGSRYEGVRLGHLVMASCIMHRSVMFVSRHKGDSRVYGRSLAKAGRLLLHFMKQVLHGSARRH